MKKNIDVMRWHAEEIVQDDPNLKSFWKMCENKLIFDNDVTRRLDFK